MHDNTVVYNVIQGQWFNIFKYDKLQQMYYDNEQSEQ